LVESNYRNISFINIMNSQPIILFACSLVLASFSAAGPIPEAKKELIRGCYFTNWAQHRPEIWKFTPDKINASLCTHLYFAFSSMGDDFKLKSIEANDEDSLGQLGLYSQVNALKKERPELKTLLSFGGEVFQRDHADLLRKMLDNVNNRKTFIDSVIAFVRRTGFDGFDISVFPDVDTKDNFTILVKEIRAAIENETLVDGKSKLLLTAAIPAIIERIEAGIDGKALSDSLDIMNVMTFDYHTASENITGFNSPQNDHGDRRSVNSTMTYLSEIQGVPKEKLTVGFPAYGRGWLLDVNSSSNSVGSPAIGPSPPQLVSRQEGIAAYFEVCALIESKNFTEQFDVVQQVPFAFEEKVNDASNGRVWISFDNVRSYEVTLDWLKAQGYGGAFIWSIDMDDYLGQCVSSKGPYPLHHAMRSKLVK
jgi:chitinase